MKSKVDRHRIIREIIGSGRISSQEELASILADKGFDVAQATLSRDMRELKIHKLHDEKGYFYSLFSPAGLSRPSSGETESSGSIDSVEFSGPVAVLKTRPGHAAMVASVIDSASLEEVAGSIAGDDTVLLVVREGYGRDALVRSLEKVFKGLGNKRYN